MVSVIVAFYNEASYLREAIQSVLEQEFTSWELLLVDDGSSDASTAIAKEYAQQYPVKVIYLEHAGHANKGVCASRNLGLQQAKANLVALLDADDVWRPAKLLQQMDLHRRFPEAEMICEASEYWYSWNQPQRDDVIIPVGAANDRLFQPGQLVSVLYPLGKGAAPCPSGLLMKKDAASALGGFEELFTGKYQLYEDQAFLTKFYLRYKVYVSSACNNLYRQRPGSVVHWVHQQGHYHQVRAFFLHWLQQYLRNQNIRHPAARRLLQKALWRYNHPTLHLFAETAARIFRFLSKPLKR